MTITDKNYFYNTEFGLQYITAYYYYDDDIHTYTHVFKWVNTTSGSSGSWAATCTAALDSLTGKYKHTVVYLPTSALDEGEYEFTCEIKSGTTLLAQPGKYYFPVEEI